jgi:hypothetical protein
MACLKLCAQGVHGLEGMRSNTTYRLTQVHFDRLARSVSSWRTSQCSRVLLNTFFRALGKFWIQDTGSAAILGGRSCCSTAKITSALAAKLSSR